ncbi:MAG: methyltransferase domain-containing protein [Geminicoccaceae bacterium]
MIRHETYGEDFGRTSWHTASEQAEVAALLGLGPGVRLLDVGCGSGGRAAFRVADCTAPLPLADGAINAVLCIDAINHLPGRPGTLREWARLLRPGGRLLFTDPVVVTGPVARTELDARAGVGFFLFVPPRYDEAVRAAAGTPPAVAREPALGDGHPQFLNVQSITDKLSSTCK